MKLVSKLIFGFILISINALASHNSDSQRIMAEVTRRIQPLVSWDIGNSAHFMIFGRNASSKSVCLLTVNTSRSGKYKFTLITNESSKSDISFSNKESQIDPSLEAVVLPTEVYSFINKSGSLVAGLTSTGALAYADIVQGSATSQREVRCNF